MPCTSSLGIAVDVLTGTRTLTNHALAPQPEEMNTRL